MPSATRYRTANYRAAIAAAICGMAATACIDSKPAARDGDSRADSVPVAAPPQPQLAAASPPPSDSSGARIFNWTLGALETQLRSEGLQPVAIGEIRQPFIGGPGMRYRLSGGEVQAFVYADAGAVARDTDELDTVRVAPPTMMIDWVMPPKLIVDNNLVLIVLTRDDALREKIRAAVSVERPSHTRNY